MVNRYLRVLVAINLALASCGSPKNLGPSFGGGGELPEQAKEAVSIHPIEESQSKAQYMTLETMEKSDFELSPLQIEQNLAQNRNIKQPIVVKIQDTIQPPEQSLPAAPKKVKKGSGMLITGMLAFGLGRFALRIGIKNKISLAATVLGLILAMGGLAMRKNAQDPVPNSQTRDLNYPYDEGSLPPESEEVKTPASEGMSETEKKTLLWAGVVVFSTIVFSIGFLMWLTDVILYSSALDLLFYPFGEIISIAGLALGLVSMIGLIKSDMELKRERKARQKGAQ